MKFRKIDIWASISIFILALALRIFFLLSSPRLSLQGDSEQYIRQACRFTYSSHSWAEYKESINLMAWRGPVYPIFLSLFLKISHSGLFAARLGQVILDSLTCVLLYLLGRSFGSRRMGIIAGIMAAFYTPFLFSATSILQECLTGFLTILTVFFLMRTFKKPVPRLFFTSGLSLGLLMLCRAVMLYLPFFLAIPIGISIWSGHKRLFNLLGFISGLLAVIIPWIILVSIIPPQQSVGTTLGYGGRPWILNYLKCDGFQPDVSSIEQITPEDSRIGGKAFSSSPSPQDRLLFLTRALRYYPNELIPIYLKNILRLWDYPYMTYWPPFILSDSQLYFFHRVIIILALIGIPISLAYGGKSLIPIAFLTQTSIFVALVHIESRYNIPLMPIVILLSAIALDCIAGALTRVIRLREKWPCLTSGTIFLGFTLLTIIFSLPVLVGLFPGDKIVLVRWLRVTLLNLWLLSLIWLIFNLVKLQLNRSRAFITAFFLLISLVGIFNFRVLADKRWSSWMTRLTRPGQRVRQEFFLPDNIDLNQYDQASLLIDMQRNKNQDFPVIVEANGNVLPCHFNPGWTCAPTDKTYRQIASQRELLIPNIRQWIEVPLDIALLEDRRLTAEIYFQSPGNQLDIWGDFRTTDKPASYLGPALPASSRPEILTSMSKWLLDWDMRLDEVTPLRPARVTASYKNQDWSDHDLSDARGRQTGAYRIRLRLLTTSDQNYVYF